MSTYANFPYRRQFEQFVASNLMDSMNGMRSGLNARKRQRVSIQDNTSYQQWKKYSIRSGRKRRGTMPILRSNLVRMDYTFKGLSDSFDGRGLFAMMHNRSDVPDAGTGEYSYTQPLYTLALNSCRQAALTLTGSVGQVFAPAPMRSYIRTGDGPWIHSGVLGVNPPGSFDGSLQCSSDEGSNSGAMGPSGFLNWTDVKLNLWGARLRQTVFYIDICRAIDPEANPYRYSPNTVLPPALGQHLDEIMRPLTVNPLATANNLTKSPWKVLKRIKVELDPILTTEGDTNGHCKTIDIFNRWGRIVDFKDSVYSPSSVSDDNSKYVNPLVGVRDDATSVVNMWPADDKLLFLVIRSTCFSRTINESFNADIHASFDLSFRSSWTKLN